MESDDSDSDDDPDTFILLTERVEDANEEKQELTLSITQDNESVGYINAIIINAGLLKEDVYFSEKLKCKNKEDEEEILLFYNSLKEDLNTHIVFYITDFFLEKPYRGNGLGGIILNNLPLWLTDHHPEVNDLYLYPYPLEKQNGKVVCVKDLPPDKVQELRNHLVTFYMSHGLQKTSTQFLKMSIR